MKQWFAVHILSTNDLMLEEALPITNKDFALSLGLVVGALSMMAILVRLIGG
jgi:hypothetical protein